MGKELSEEEFEQALVDLTLLGIIDYDENSGTINGFTEYGWALIRKAVAKLRAERTEVFKKASESISAEVAMRVMAEATKDRYRGPLLSLDDPMAVRLYNAYQVLTYIFEFLFERSKRRVTSGV